MAYVLYKEYTKRFISYTDTGKVIHTSTLEKAYKFDSITQAKKARKKATKKTNLFYVYKVLKNGDLEKVSITNNKRKSFTVEERKEIYSKTNGHCYLCGDFVDFDKFEVEHNLPLGKGGTNDFENLFPSCHICNKIFMYQMEKKSNNRLRWKIVHRMIEKCLK